MSSDSSDTTLKTLGLVAVGAGLGVALGVAIDGANKRARFAQQARDELAAAGVTLVGSVFGSDSGTALWIMTVLLPNNQVLTIEVPVGAGHDPFTPETVQSVTRRVVKYLRSRKMLAA